MNPETAAGWRDARAALKGDDPRPAEDIIRDVAFRGEIERADFDAGEDYITVTIRAPKNTRVGHWNVEVRRVD